jgi:hypothetical protein
MYIIAAAIALLALIGVLTWTHLAPAQVPGLQPFPQGKIETITAGAVEVRSGPGTNCYASSTLKNGDQVEVIDDGANHPGWLAIRPPRGSKSWIQVANVKIEQANNPSQGKVHSSSNMLASVRPDSITPNEEFSVESVKLPSGTPVMIVGPHKLDKSGTAWLPILPPERDLRYIPNNAIAKVDVIQQTGAQGPSGFVSPPGGPPLISQADKTLDQAKQLYQLAAQSNDPNERAQAQNRLQALQQIPSVQPGYPGSATTAGNVSKVTLGTQTSSSGGNTALYQTATLSTEAARWSSWGILRATTLPPRDGQPVYRLEDAHGSPLGYAVAAPGLSLQTYVGQTCCLYGTVVRRSDDPVRANVTVVSQIALQPAH